MTYLQVIQQFEANSNPKIAEKQKAYLKNKFNFYGLKAPLRKELQRPFLLKSNLPNKPETIETIKTVLYKIDKRELHYFSIEWFLKYKKEYDIDDIDFIKFLIGTNSWWDTVDTISSNICGAYFLRMPQQRETILPQWISSNDFWFNRSAILFQLKYKTLTNTNWLQKSMEPHFSSKEFFLQKAIGWALREYAKTNPEWVKNYLLKNQDKMANLSVREATKHLKLN